MASRIFWFLVAGVALIGGMVLQDGGTIFSWGDAADDSRSVEQRIEAGVDRAIDQSVDKMEVVDSEGKEVDISAETKRALADAVSRLVKAEAELAVLQIRDGTAEQIETATVARDQAKTDVETLKAKIEGQKDLANEGRQAARDQIRTEVRETVRDAVRN
jgi:hypothetical protein